MTPLERRYERLLLLYPSGYRRERGPEIMSTLLSASRPDQVWPSPSETFPLIGQAVRMRLGVAQSQPIGRLLIAIGPAQLILASLVSVMALFGAEWNPLWGRHVLPGGQFGPFQTVGIIAFLCWIAAGVAVVFDDPKITRSLVVMSMLATVSLVPISRAFAVDRPTLGLLVFLFVLGLPILVSHPESIRAGQSERLKSTLIIASLVVGTLVALVLLPNWDGSTLHRYSQGDYGLSPSFVFYEISLPSVAAWLVWATSAALVASAALHVTGRRIMAGSFALSGLPLLVLWFGSRDGFVGWPGPRGHLVVGVAMAAASLLLVGLSVVHPYDRAKTRAR
jgi:hypothetical protein